MTAAGRIAALLQTLLGGAQFILNGAAVLLALILLDRESHQRQQTHEHRGTEAVGMLRGRPS